MLPKVEKGTFRISVEIACGCKWSADVDLLHLDQRIASHGLEQVTQQIGRDIIEMAGKMAQQPHRSDVHEN